MGAQGLGRPTTSQSWASGLFRRDKASREIRYFFFLAVFFLAVVFLAVVFFLGDRLAVFFLAVVFLAVVFLVVFFLVAILLAPEGWGPKFINSSSLRGAQAEKGRLTVRRNRLLKAV